MTPIQVNPMPQTPADMEKMLEVAIKAIHKREKDPGLVQRLGSRVGIVWPHIPTGIASLDLDVFGIGGVPRHRIVELHGPESGGKSTLALTTVASAQRIAKAANTGKKSAYIDSEHAIDVSWASILGVDVDDLLICQPDYGEQGLEVACELLETGAIDVMVIDSVAALVPKVELEGEMTDAQVGAQARMMAKACRKLTGVVNKTGATLIFINQLREKIGVMFGDPTGTPGGRAVKHAASVRLNIRKVGKLGKEGGDDGVAISNTVKISAPKNKMAAPFRETELTLTYGVGFDKAQSLVDSAITRGVIEVSGSWLSFNGEKLSQGKDNAVMLVREDVDLNEKLSKAVYKTLNLKEVESM